MESVKNVRNPQRETKAGTSTTSWRAAIWQPGTFRHHEGTDESPPETPPTPRKYVRRGLREALSWAPIMPGGASLSDSRWKRLQCEDNAPI